MVSQVLLRWQGGGGGVALFPVLTCTVCLFMVIEQKISSPSFAAAAEVTLHAYAGIARGENQPSK